MLDEYRAIAELDDLKAKALRYNTAAYGRDFPLCIFIARI